MLLLYQNKFRNENGMKKLVLIILLLLVQCLALLSCNTVFEPDNTPDTPKSEDTDTNIPPSNDDTIIPTTPESGDAIPSSPPGEDGEDDSKAENDGVADEDDNNGEGTPGNDTKPDTDYYKTTNFSNFKAIWLSQFDLVDIYTENGSQRSEAEMRSALNVVFDNIKKYGFNTVIIQLRPYADSFYPSNYYPPSSYAVGVYSKDFLYDPFAITVSIAKEKGLSVQGWINPLRGMKDSELMSIKDSYAIKQWYNDENLRGKYIVNHSGRWYLNPAYHDVRSLITDGALEALLAYKLDGIHMDDYFYPSTDASFDSAAYDDYILEGNSGTLGEFRRSCLNELIKNIYSSIKEANPSALFGISPAGNWTTVYESQYADYKTWCSVEGFIDYICPQAYFGLEHQSFDFKKVCNTWQSFITLDSVKLIVGITFGKAQSGTDQYAGSGKNEWRDNKDILKRCLEYTTALEKCHGVSVFCYQYLNHPLTGAEDTSTKEEKDNFIPVLQKISW